MTPKELCTYYIEKIVEERELLSKLKLFFPDEITNLKTMIPEKHDHHITKVKTVDGLGKFYYFGRKGKMQFHEFILDHLCKELKKRKIPYIRPNKKRGPDLIIRNKKIEVETRSNPASKPENRPKLEQRIRNDPKNQILVCMNQRDKRAYMQSEIRNILISNNQIITYKEFLERLETIFKK